MFKEFKKFILRGNVVDLAVAVVIGAAFSGVVNSFVKDLLNPLIGLVPGNKSLSDHVFHLHGAQFLYGDWLNTVISFLLVSGVIFFLVVKPINHLTELSRRRKPTPDPTTRQCPECLGEIPIQATRCMYCTTKLKPAAE